MRSEFSAINPVVSDLQKELETTCTSLLALIGEDTTREGLLSTPTRFAKAFQYLTKGYNEKVEEIINGALFTSDSTGIVIVKDIDFYSMCEHHILPFFGKVHIAYLPNGKVLGLSKFARLLDVFSRRLQIQEQLNEQITDALEQTLNPKGIIVSIEATHMCMSMRGVQKSGSKTLTTVSRGALDEEPLRNTTLMKFFNSSFG